jgi:uncharacterized protein
MKIIGREKEIVLLQSLFGKEESSFVAVYGRRRVGKTFLIRQVYQKHILFECSGVHQKNMAHQLENFWRTLIEIKSNKIASPTPKTWIEAFFQLRAYLNTLSEDTPKVIFLDEIAWFETPRSGFLGALDSFWNQYCTKRADIVLVICGSAASWIINKVVNDRGGLHNRLTNCIQLMPFTLGETAAFFAKKRIKLSLKEIAQIHMCVGGVPFYLKDIENGFSVPQILDQLFLGQQARLKNEFKNLYASLFKNNTLHEKVVEALASKNKGLTRKEIIETTGIHTGGSLSIVLEELIQCGFIQQIYPIQKSKEDLLYRLIDEYSLFYFKFLIEDKVNNSWAKLVQKPSYKIWSGYAFENLCFKHIPQIKKALGISGMITNEYSYIYKGDEDLSGVQIDLVIDRDDNCMNVLEVKFHNEEFVVTEEYERQLRRKVYTFQTKTRTRKNIFITMLSVYGVKKNEHYLSVVTNQLLLEDLFT